MRYFVDVLHLAGYGVGLEQRLLAAEYQLLELAPRLLGGRKKEPDVFLVSERGGAVSGVKQDGGDQRKTNLRRGASCWRERTHLYADQMSSLRLAIE